MEWLKFFHRVIIQDYIGRIREEDEVLRDVLQSDRSDLQPILHREVFFRKVDGEFMLFLTLLKQTHKEDFLDLLIGNDAFQMAHTTMPSPCLLLHALQVIISVAVDTKEGIFMAAYFFLAKTDSLVRQVIDIVHLGAAMMGLFVMVVIVVDATIIRFQTAGLRIRDLWRVFGLTTAGHNHIIHYLLFFQGRCAHPQHDLGTLLRIIKLRFELIQELTLKETFHYIRYSMANLITLLIKIFGNFLECAAFFEFDKKVGAQGFKKAFVDILVGAREERFTKVFQQFFLNLIVQKLLQETFKVPVEFLWVFGCFHGLSGLSFGASILRGR